MALVSRAKLVASLLFSLLSLVPLSACEEAGPRVYTARAFDAEARCLGPDAPIGLVEAEDLEATCEPTCLELGADLYVSTVCPPYPDDSLRLTADGSPECAAALSAFSEERACEE